MSADIFLVKFELDSNSAYVDGMSDLVESVSVPSDIFRSLVAGTDAAKLSKLQVFEDESKTESFEIGCYLPSDVSMLRARLREMFLAKVRDSAAAAGSDSAIQINVKLLEEMLGELKVITSLDALLTRKLQGFRDDDSVVVRADINE